jgi:glycosyltransferase involved in cell wall biosynthesis
MEVNCIIPAYNEDKTIADVIYAVKEAEIVKKIVVVSDGSTDDTALIARSMGACVVELENNVGKGGAIKAGLKMCNSDIVLLLDADLIGLNKRHIYSLLIPVLNDSADMSIGIFSRGRLVTDLAQKIVPQLSGQRAVKKYIVDNIPNIDLTRYGIEVALTKYVEKENIRIEEVELADMSHYTKEEKLGLARGLAARM